MPVQALPRSAVEYGRDQRAEIGAAIAAVGRIWRGMGDEFDASYARIEGSLLAVVGTAQLRVAEGAVEYVPAVLEETGQRRAVAASAEVVPSALVGVAGDGRPVDGLLYGSVIRAKQGVAEGRSAAQALAASGQWLSMAVGTVLSDTGRAAEKVGMAVRPVSGYVRMLNPPSCSRCAILAGSFYRSSTAFQRHPGCDCRHIPASEAVANDLTVNVNEYFDSLPAAEQDRIFTKAGAEAIREGADINQVVNARRGMNTATTPSGRRVLAPVRIGGQDVFITRESITRRGSASRALTGRRGERLMPESIQQIATDKADYLRLLRANGYIR
jgi:hypothetical protein